MTLFNHFSFNVDILLKYLRHVGKPFILVVLVLQVLHGQEKIATVKHPDLDEQSSIVRSKTYPEVYWVTNDSDKKPYLFPLTEAGDIIIPDWMKRRYASNSDETYPGIHLDGSVLYDWESLAVLNDTIVIGDVGNNGNARRDLGIYLLPEPNPYTTPRARPLVWLPIRYEDQKSFPPTGEWEYDCEAIFTFRGKIYFLTKHRADQHINKPAPSTKLYRMDTRSTTRSNILKLVSRLDDLGGWVTGADVAPDQSGLVFIAQNPFATTIWYFPAPKKGDDFLAQKPRRYNLIKADQAEGVCFKDKNTIIVTNEQRDWFEVPLSKFK